MPFIFKSYENAKEKANKRLTKWIERTKEENYQTGITRLQKVHKNLFKKIEWKPKADKNSRESETDLIIPVSNKTCDSEEGAEVMTPNLASIYQEDHQIHDSNSSNVSSRLQSRREEIKFSETKTPLPRTPFSRTECSENIDTTQKFHSEEKLKRGSTKDGLKNEFSLPIQFPKRRKKKKQKKGTHEEKHFTPKLIVNDDLEGQQRDAPMTVTATTGFAPSQLNVVASSISVLKRKSSTVLGGMFHSPASKISAKGTVDSILKRSMKTQKYTRAFGVTKHEMGAPKQDLRELSKEDRRNEVLKRFRKLVRQLIHVRVLLNVSRIRIEEEEKSKGFKRFDGGTELSFDAMMYKTAISYGGLTSRARKALKKNPADRNEEDAMILMEVMLRMNVFLKYPKSVRQDLARVIWYDNFKDGRVIVKQGDPGTRMYFVVSGEVDLKRTERLVTGEEITYHMSTVTAGYTFGELALIRDMRREFTAVCKGNSEFLSLSKGEFNQVLRSRWEKECNIRFNFLRSCDYFLSWTDKQLQICADSSILKEYPDNKVIIGDTDRQTESVYFIRKGRCDVVRRILVVRQGSPYLRPQILLPEKADDSREVLNKIYARNRRIRKKETHFLTVTTLHPGSYFGAGENLRDTFILSRGKTECVLINCAQYSIQGKSEQLRTLRRDRENSIPSNQKLYNKFQVNRRWFEYRNKLLQDILNKKRVKKSSSTMADVPKAILSEPAIPRDLIFYK